MQFKILSHACLLIRQGKTSILVDPWLVGSCYWRSWWNFPEAVFDEAEVQSVDAVVISHIHWDHWHGLTLKKLLRGKRIIVPDEPGLRSADDLHAIGFKDILRLPHGQTLTLGELRITLYQFGRYLNDAAVVVDGGGNVLLDANDAKIAGVALQHIVQRHGPIDFAFRSHSSANSRICFKIDGEPEFAADDREHYFRSFQCFMDVVKPRFAVPFASNHCHLHADVFRLNSFISNPVELRQWLGDGAGCAWKLQVMLPGSSWSSDSGFALAPETVYDDLPASLESYRQKVGEKLLSYTAQENAVKVTDRLLERFMEFFAARGRPAAVHGAFVLSIHWPDGRREAYRCDIQALTAEPMPAPGTPASDLPVIEMPAIVFRDSVVKNMFHHASISKRCNFLAANPSDMERLDEIVSFLDLSELGVYPQRWAYRFRLVSAYLRRWRELIVYAHALWLLKIRKKPLYMVEEAILKGEF